MRASWAQVLAFRQARQHLPPGDPCPDQRVLAHELFGLHAQLARSARSAAAARGAASVDGLLKTWWVRGTLHLVDPEDLAVFVAAMSTLRPRHHTPSWSRYHGISRPQVDAALAAIPQALDGTTLTREALADAVVALTGDPGVAHALQDGWGATLKLAAFRGDLVFAAIDGAPVRFTRPALPPLPDAAEACAEVARRALRAYGPWTREELAKWFGHPSAAQCGRWIAALGDEVAEVEVDGTARWLLAEDVTRLESAVVPAGLEVRLPAFDPFVVAGPRSGPAFAIDPALVFRKGGWLSAVVVRDGRIADVWDDVP